MGQRLSVHAMDVGSLLIRGHELFYFSHSVKIKCRVDDVNRVM